MKQRGGTRMTLNMTKYYADIYYNGHTEERVHAVFPENSNQHGKQSCPGANLRVHCSSWYSERRVMSRSFHCLSEVCNGASLRERLMFLAASRMPRNTMVLKLSPPDMIASHASLFKKH